MLKKPHVGSGKKLRLPRRSRLKPRLRRLKSGKRPKRQLNLLQKPPPMPRKNALSMRRLRK